VGIVVNDLDKTRDFWINTLGFKLHIEAKEESPYIDKLLAIKNPVLTTIKLIDSKGFLIELLKFDNYEVENSWSGDLKTTGLTHIALTVDNLENLKAKLTQNGYEFVSNTLNSPNGFVNVVFVRGPEGLMLELVDELVKK
jgi:catechol 2,3-dioxygenase-like lactoylglutathione lyase family enzyme